MKRLILLLIASLSTVLLVFIQLPTAKGAPEETWIVVHKEEGSHWDRWEFYYGSGSDWPQYGVLYRNSGFFRLIYGPNSAWGTSVILLPSFWSGGIHYRGTPDEPINLTWKVEGNRLVLSITGLIGGLEVSSEVTLSPPKRNEYIYAAVSTEVENSVPLDNRPGEAFKPVEFSSMHISSTRWDTQAAYACLRTSQIPASGWIFDPPVYASIFGLEGGISDWQREQQQGKPAPTMEVWLDRPMAITGWVTPSNDENDDNVGFWAASDQILSTWRYVLRVAPGPGPKTGCISVYKEASPSPVQDGEPLTYTIRVTNTAGVNLTAAITDILPSHVEPNEVLNWWPIMIGPGDTWIQHFSVTAKEGYTGELRNTVQVTTEEGPMGWARVTVCSNKCLYYLPLILK
jgi:uncharacterized repeat protein (TIGR01451 family)